MICNLIKFSPIKIYHNRAIFSKRSSVICQLKCFSTKSKISPPPLESENSLPKVANVTKYLMALSILMLGFAYASVPLYQRFCKTQGASGQQAEKKDFKSFNYSKFKDNDDSQNESKVKNMVDRIKKLNVKRKKKIYTVHFHADTNSNMAWNFRPLQPTVKIAAGETALAFYRAKNPCNDPVIGVSTYSVQPQSAGLHFNKIQCFCFEDQLLNANEEVDLPIFFFLDPDIDEEETMMGVNHIHLSYTFFKSKNNTLFNVEQGTANNTSRF